ncbi:MAG: hypothetical protein AB8B91_06230 [Rubripirellula sp.]
MQDLFLLLQFMEGDQQTLPILADMLDEAGDSHLSGLVRSRKNTKRKMLQLAIELLPYRLRLIACVDFFRQVAADHVPDSSVLIENLNNARWWAEEVNVTTPNAELEYAFDQAATSLKDYLERQLIRQVQIPLRSHFITQTFESALGQLNELMEVAGMAMELERSGDHEKLRRCNNRMRTAATKVASYARDLQTQHARWSTGSMEAATVAQWNHLMDLVREAIERE